MDKLEETLLKFLDPYLRANETLDGKPLIVLTWAQSLDAKIAPNTRTPIALSGLETKFMTHLIRRRMDAILIGAETAVVDNPSLNARIPVDGLDGEWVAAPMDEQPRPIILDPNRRARLPKLLHLVGAGQAKSPWIFCREEGEAVDNRHIPLEMVDGRFSWDDILSHLSSRGIKTIMIEGGSNVISDILSKRLADVIIITIAPAFIGGDGVGIHPALHKEEWLHDTKAIGLGKDMVIAGRMNH